MIDWNRRLDAWRSFVSLKSFAPVNEATLVKARESVKGLPGTLQAFYRVTNGLSAGVFKVLPVEDPRDIKRTWDGLQRANDPRLTRFLGRSAQLLSRFIVFADVGVGRAGVFDREDGSIWYEDEDQLRQTNLSLDGFIEATLRGVAGA